jgi:hypothetical protein
MKPCHSRILSGIALILIQASPGAQANSGFDAADIPGPPDTSRYEELWTLSPFTRSLNLSQTMELSGFANIGGSPVVTLHNKETGDSHVVTEQTNAEGWRLISLENIENPLETVARIHLSGQEFSVRFNKDQLAPEKAYERRRSARERVRQFRENLANTEIGQKMIKFRQEMENLPPEQRRGAVQKFMQSLSEEERAELNRMRSGAGGSQGGNSDARRGGNQPQRSAGDNPRPRRPRP